MRRLLALVPLIASLAAAGQTPPADMAASAASARLSAVAAAVDIVDRAALQRGARAQVLVLGTAHLNSAPPAIAQPARFEALVARLATFQPDLLAVESLAGAQCDYLRSHAFAYEGTADEYCPDPRPARARLQLDGAAAEREVEAMLQGSRPLTPGQQRRLAALFLAIGEPASAAVQWLRLPPAERVADAVLTAELVAQIDRHLARPSEDSLIAIPLALRLGLQRLYPVDDHTGDRATGPIDETAWQADMARLWKNDATETRQRLDAHAVQQAVASGDVSGWYTWLNSVQAARLAMDSDFAAAAADLSARRTGRAYLAYWETRNLRMVANIREVLGRSQARRALLIVGASHKPYYERYLGMTSDIELLPIDPWLSATIP